MFTEVEENNITIYDDEGRIYMEDKWPTADHI